MKIIKLDKGKIFRLRNLNYTYSDIESAHVNKEKAGYISHHGYFLLLEQNISGGVYLVLISKSSRNVLLSKDLELIFLPIF